MKNTERKRLIKPVTLLKVKAYLQDIQKHISERNAISLDLVAREHSLSGSIGTAMIRMKMIKPSGLIKGLYDIDDWPESIDSELWAITIMENIRVHNLKLKDKSSPVFESGGIYPNGDTLNRHRINSESNPEERIILTKKDPHVSELSGLLKKALSGVQQQNQLGIFDGTKAAREEQLKILCAIATSTYNSIGDNLSDHSVQCLNERIVSASANLLKQFNESLLPA